MPDDIALSNISCRILVLSSSASQATSFISRVQSHNGIQPTPKATEPSEENIPTNAQAPSSGLVKIPWTITNRYYSALVHFAVHALHGLSAHQIQNVPAVIFVWAKGESYRHHVERIVEELTGHEPEVCLAARVPPDPSISYDIDDQPEDDIDIDTFLSSHGFEYVDVIDSSSFNVDQEEAFAEGIPGLSRVLDALSTIMWPSMKATAEGSSRKADRQRERALLDWAQSSQDNTMIAEGESHLSEQQITMRQEMRELTLWLEGEEFLCDDPWKPASSAMVSASPTDEIFIPETGDKVITGFDDNFTVFVSSPPLDSFQSSRSPTPEIETKPIGLLSLPHSGDVYRSLGSDFGSDDGMDGDEGLPTQEEIAATSRLLFGDQAPGSMDSSEFSGGTGASLGLSGSGGAEPYELAPFDLSKVLGALQEMKAEIGMMDDEGERRKAAARVALGLVYGLDDRDCLP